MQKQNRVVVFGVCGSGKSTVGALLAAARSATFIDADSLHPAANKAKMSAGQPLTDEDRAPWLALVAQALASGGGTNGGVVVACSALRRAYRDVLSAAAAPGEPRVRFVQLSGSREILAERMAARVGHYMPLSLLDSQLALLEPLQTDEAGLSLDVSPPAATLAATAAAALDAAPAAWG